jgi:uncharacterized membrane protein
LVAKKDNFWFSGQFRWRWIFTGLSALGLALSGYLGWHYLTGANLVGCGVESSCDHVLNGRWSVVAGGLPVSGVAAGTYLALLLASFFIGQSAAPPIRQLAWRAMVALSAAAGGSAAWFIALQAWVIGAFCPYCLATHAVSLILATLVVWQAHSRNGSEGAPVGGPAGLPSSIFRPVLLGLALAGFMAASQVIFPPAPAFRAGQSQGTLAAVDPHVVPLIGSPDAACVVNLLFDYECPHCQQVHLMLDEVVRRYQGKVAFALCPTPLNTKCNPFIPRDVPEFADSCELARIGLAVWVADHRAFSIFDRWMYSFESGDRWRPRSLAAAKTKAAELVGKAKFDAALGDPWVERYLQASLKIYGNTIHDGNTAVPKLVFGSRWVIPQPDSVDDLVSILHNSLAVPIP